MPKKILVIDNDQDILDIISLILQESGYEVMASKSPKILDNISQIQPDLILVDNWLVGTAGNQLCKTLKAGETTNHIPVILISTDNSLVQTATECGADNYIQKPFDIQYLTNMVEAAI